LENPQSNPQFTHVLHVLTNSAVTYPPSPNSPQPTQAEREARERKRAKSVGRPSLQGRRPCRMVTSRQPQVEKGRSEGPWPSFQACAARRQASDGNIGALALEPGEHAARRCTWPGKGLRMGPEATKEGIVSWTSLHARASPVLVGDQQTAPGGEGQVGGALAIIPGVRSATSGQEGAPEEGASSSSMT
jgi:hypothetical protein